MSAHVNHIIRPIPVEAWYIATTAVAQHSEVTVLREALHEMRSLGSRFCLAARVLRYQPDHIDPQECRNVCVCGTCID